MSLMSNFNMSFSRIGGLTSGLGVGAQLNLSSSIGKMAMGAGLADLFSPASMTQVSSSFTSFGPGGGFSLSSGFLPAPAPPASMFHGAMQGAFIGAANVFGGQAWGASLAGALAGAPPRALFGGAGPLFGGFGGMHTAVGGMAKAVESQLALGYSSQMGLSSAYGSGYSSSSTRVTNTPARFPQVKGDSYLNTLSNPRTKAGKRANAKALNVNGKHDVKTINKAIRQLDTAEAKVRVAKAGEKTGKGKLVLSASEVEAIRNAPNDTAAKAVLQDIVRNQTGARINPNMRDKKGIRKKGSRQALNRLLGTKVRNGKEKNSGSSMVMDSMLESIAKSVRQGNMGSTTVTKEYAAGMLGSDGLNSMGWFAAGSESMSVENGSRPLAVDLDEYRDAAKTVGELYSPLIFDLEGLGLKIKDGGLIEVDLDGDGKTEMVTELDEHIGLLVFDSKYEEKDETLNGAGRDMFGNGTDLSAYGIEGSFENGFDALRALAEHLKLVKGDKQHLDTHDLMLLEEAVGLRMRIGGVVSGQDRKFDRVGITRINLGESGKIGSLEASPEDGYGNKLMHQEGATFVVKGEERAYADLWFNILARTNEEVDAALTDLHGTAALLASQRR